MRRAAVIIAAVIVLAASGCGQSPEEKAKARRQQAVAKMCSVGADLAGRVARLDALRADQLDLDRVQNELFSIAVGLKQIRTVQDDLGAARARQVRAAESAFRAQLGTVLQGLVIGRDLGAGGIETDLERGLDELGGSYRRTLAPATAGSCE